MHENREISEMSEENLVDRPAGEGVSRTSRTHVSEESDSGIIPFTAVRLQAEQIQLVAKIV